GLCAVPLFSARHVGRALQYRLRITTQIPSQLRGDFYIKQAASMQGGYLKGTASHRPAPPACFAGHLQLFYAQYPIFAFDEFALKALILNF
ncbi:MAG: hypothetical protein IIW33_04395, partial [Oscillospiraceae bacterium]|nr:hypothetical protein [Oscillospiraceae bacterium]